MVPPDQNKLRSWERDPSSGIWSFDTYLIKIHLDVVGRPGDRWPRPELPKQEVQALSRRGCWPSLSTLNEQHHQRLHFPFFSSRTHLTHIIILSCHVVTQWRGFFFFFQKFRWLQNLQTKSSSIFTDVILMTTLLWFQTSRWIPCSRRKSARDCWSPTTTSFSG